MSRLHKSSVSARYDSREGGTRETEGDTLAAQPASHQPVSEATLKAVLLSLKRNMQADLHLNLAKLITQIEMVGERTDHVERKMGEYASKINELVDGYQAQAEDIQYVGLRIKLRTLMTGPVGTT